MREPTYLRNNLFLFEGQLVAVRRFNTPRKRAPVFDAWYVTRAVDGPRIGPLSLSLSLSPSDVTRTGDNCLVSFKCLFCCVRYKRYKLGDLKDFDSLFFPEKRNLLKILSNFEEKKGTLNVNKVLLSFL